MGEVRESRPPGVTFEEWRYVLPQPLSVLHKRQREQCDAVGRLQCAIAQVEGTLEFLAAIAFADALAMTPAAEFGARRTLVKCFENAGSGRLLAVIDGCVDVLAAKREAPFVEGFGDLHNREHPWRVAIDILVDERNGLTHGLRHPSPAQADDILRRLLGQLVTFEEGVANALGSYLLAWADRSEQAEPERHQFYLYPLRGAWRTGDPIRLLASTPPLTRTPLLVDPQRDRCLTLGPLVQWYAPPHGLDARVGEERCLVLSAHRGEPGVSAFYFRDPMQTGIVPLRAPLLEDLLGGCQILPGVARPVRMMFGLDRSQRGRLDPSESGPQLLRERYEFRARIGQGATGYVWFAINLARREACAVKVMHEQYANDRTFRERFEREYRILTRLSHEGIVRCLHYGSDGAGAPYLELELVEGPNLAEYLRASGPLGAESAVEFTAALLDAIEVAHTNGVLHRDVGPRNILCKPGPRPCLIDFGIARPLDGTQLTQQGAPLGTHAYAAPEQLQGDRADFRSDIYSVGRVLLSLLRGRELRANEGLSFNGEIPEALAAVISRATSLNPRERYGTAADMRAALLAAVVPRPKPSLPDPEAFMHDEVTQDALALQTWFDTEFRPFLERQDLHDRATELATRVERVVRLARESDEDQAVCFLGNSGVGKSTLINALAADGKSLLPHGGVGPLTAQATSVRSADKRSLRAEYFGAETLNQVLFSIERQIERSASNPNDADPTVEEGENRRDTLRKQALLMVTGTQYVKNRPEPTLQYLADALRKAMGFASKWNETITAEDDAHLTRISACLELARQQLSGEFVDVADHRTFLREISTHATGFLAPLIRRLEVGWPSKSMPRGVVLVDLPGIGVAGDVHREIANEWVRGPARAIVVVVDRSGVTEAVAHLLRSSGFLARLHHSADDLSVDPVALVIVVVKADEVATANRKQDVDEHGRDEARSWGEHIEAVRREADAVMRDQLRNQLRALVTDEDTGAQRGERLHLVDELLGRVEVHTVTATQYRALFDDDDEHPKITDAAQSGIPGLAASLERIAQDRRAALALRAHAQAEDFRRALRAEFDMVRQHWEEDRRAHEEVERLRDALEEFLVSVRTPLDARRGAFREYLRNTAPLLVETRVKDATAEAEKQIRQYLKKLHVQEWHHRTLQAAVRRGGTFQGSRHVTFPDDFTVIVEDQIAVVWSKQLLSGMRAETRALADAYETTIQTILEWARLQGARARPQAIERLQERLAGDARSLNAVGNDAIDELRKRVLKELRTAIATAIEERCKEFVREGDNDGGGVKNRILELLTDELVPGSVAAARKRATVLLQTRLAAVADEVTAALRRLPDPVDESRKLVLVQAERQALREQARLREQVLAELEKLAAMIPLRRAHA